MKSLEQHYDDIESHVALVEQFEESELYTEFLTEFDDCDNDDDYLEMYLAYLDTFEESKYDTDGY